MINYKNSLIAILFSIILVCKPISYETIAESKYVFINNHRLLSKEQVMLDTSFCIKNPFNSRKKEKLDPGFQRLLEKHFPDWDQRITYQQKQTNVYESAMKKKLQATRLGMKESFKYTKEEQDAINYFQGTGFYARHQDPETRPNIFDTRQSFLRTMHNPELRHNFLDSFNRQNS